MDHARPRLVTEPGVGYRLIDRDADGPDQPDAVISVLSFRTGSIGRF